MSIAARAILTASLAGLFSCLSTAGAESADSQGPPLAYDPTDRYLDRELEGWPLKVHKALAEEAPELCEQTLAVLRMHLMQIVRAAPAPAVEKLRQVPIWIERHHPKHPCMCYHPSSDWLRTNGFNPEKVQCVELANPENFLKWTLDQPWMVLHELAHAYHDRFLGGFENPEIAAAFSAAKEEGLYRSVLHIRGHEERAYAAVNPMEYFAETAEAFFGTNDFYPFVRAELKRHDPRMYALHRKLWHVE